jgi:glycosyltransferase involved in cell wall biosynthesis
LVSVIVPAFNAERTIGALLRALAGQLPISGSDNAGGGHEIIVVDNGSTDGTCSIVESRRMANVRLVAEPRRGPSAARNRGLSDARAPIVAFIDADCIPSRPWLRELTAAFADPSVLIVAGGLASYQPRTGAQRFAAQYGLNDSLRMVQMPRMPFANSRNVAVRRMAAIAVGGFPEDLLGAEDVEFSFRIRERFGCSITHRESALAFHQDREDDESLRIQAMSYGRSMAALYERHPDILRWGTVERLRRARTATKRAIIASGRDLAGRIGLGDAAMHEFARYLSLWTTWYWRGFEDARRSGRDQT